MIRMVVVFPAPSGPIRPTISPRPTANDNARIASVCPKRLVTARRVTASPAAVLAYSLISAAPEERKGREEPGTQRPLRPQRNAFDVPFLHPSRSYRPAPQNAKAAGGFVVPYWPLRPLRPLRSSSGVGPHAPTAPTH